MDIHNLIARTARAARQTIRPDSEQAGNILEAAASALLDNRKVVLEANQKDLAVMKRTNPRYDRLLLTPGRIHGIASDMRQVAALPTPVGKIISETIRPNGMTIRKVCVPFGLIGIIYEARPNVTFDVFSLCLKSGNACILKGGSDAYHSNLALVAILHETLTRFGLDPGAFCTLLPPQSEAASVLLSAEGLVDLVIPRGNSSLIRRVRQEARVPVIETGAGICHTYFDRDGDAEKGCDIITNAKTRRVSVCNALDCLIIHRERLNSLADLCSHLAGHQVRLYADPPAYAVLGSHYPAHLLLEATEESYGTEFLDYVMSIKTVDCIEDALAHIDQYGSRHSECIVSESSEAIRIFEQLVDAACVYANVSTAFTDGAQFGMGAEIGISTQKLHARGPMALEELTTYKYIIEGNGQIRPT